ncbi:unnamed protein product [Lactuca virosa]|uniref:cyclin-dependent kinase n=1 Tax=Lactuca virosa TaxID=75947 RepID=A0AAU9M838_9ASTR|nr:unnamed protein product [Lactuca virosa]
MNDNRLLDTSHLRSANKSEKSSCDRKLLNSRLGFWGVDSLHHRTCTVNTAKSQAILIRLLGCSNLDQYSPSISFYHHRCSSESEESCSGRQISRKSYSSRSEEETLSYNNRSNHRTFVSDHDQRRHRYVDGDYDRDYHRTSSQPIHQGLENRNKADDVSGNDSRRSDATKKRKFSPIVWDRAEKQVKISSKNRILPTKTVPSQSPPSKSVNDFGKFQDIIADTKIEISPVESLVSNLSDELGVSRVSSSLATNTPEEHDQEPEHEDGEYVEERNLSKSKWAFKDSPQMASNTNNSSPESGEFKQEHIEDTIEHMSCLSDEEDEQSKSLDDDEDDDERIESPVSMMPSCRNVFEYERLGKISEGTYGVVYKARDKKTGEIVALKKVKMGKEREGFPVTALREITILGSFQHPSVVKMKEVVTDDFNGVYMVMEYIDHELKGYMEKTKQPFSQSEVKRLMIQLLQGLAFLHENWVIHRDLKTSNLLLDNNGDLKICDFGMSRQYGSPVKPYTALVVTLWYRAPEVLLGMKNYTTAIDMWSVGCIMGELLSKKPLFDGNREIEQIDKIFKTLGTPNEKIWPGYSKLPGVKPSFVKQNGNSLRKRFPGASFMGTPVLTEMGFDLLNRFLTYDPDKRITAEEALNHGWFRESPLPAECVRICK